MRCLAARLTAAAGAPWGVAPALQAEEAHAAGSPESAAAKGRALLNLRLTDAEGGLLGRTLLTLVNNKARWRGEALTCWQGLLAGAAAGWQACTDGRRGASRSPPPQGGGGEPLPPHKLSPHDIVRLRPSKGDGGGPPLAEGVVYRVRDASITVAGGRRARARRRRCRCWGKLPSLKCRLPWPRSPRLPTSCCPCCAHHTPDSRRGARWGAGRAAAAGEDGQ